MNRPGRRPRRWRPRSRVLRPGPGELELLHALEIVELLANHPRGLTIREIVASLQRPAGPIARDIALLQQRRWVSLNARGSWIIDMHFAGLCRFVPEV